VPPSARQLLPIGILRFPAPTKVDGYAKIADKTHSSCSNRPNMTNAQLKVALKAHLVMVRGKKDQFIDDLIIA